MNTLNPPIIDLLLNENLVGGDPDTVLLKLTNITNKYLKEKSDKSDKLVFQFVDEYNTQKKHGSKYLGKGANTVVCAIKKNKPIGEDKIYIIRIFESNIETTTNFINNNYKRDKINFTNAIPNIYCFGKILDKTGNNIYSDSMGSYLCYTITDLYNTSFDKLKFYNKIKIFVNLLQLLNDAQQKKYFFWDLKYDNIGYDDNYNCIMIDYDERCVIEFPVGNPFWYGGTYYAVYITCLMALGHQHGMNTQQIEYENDKELLPDKFHDKLGICGLPDIIFEFFFFGYNIFGSIKHRNNYGNILHPAYNFYDYIQLRQDIKKINKIYTKERYNSFYNDIYDLLIDDDANGILSLYYDKVPSYEKMIDVFKKYDKLTTIEGGYKKYVLHK